MDTTTQVQIASVNTRDAKGQNGPFTVYEVIDSNNVRWRAKKNTFDQAALLVGQVVSFVGYSKQNGDYTNYYVNAIVGGVPAQAAPAPAQATPAAAVSNQEDAKTLSIHRQCAAKVAAKISQSPGEFWANVVDLVHYFGTGRLPLDQLPTEKEVQAAVEAATEAVQNLPAQASPSGYPQPANPDDDIPF